MPIEAVEPAHTQEKSSRNALTHGLFAVRYFIREGEDEEYAQTLASVIADLAPQGIVEETFAAEIVGATWRLRRCRMVEHSLSAGAALDPMVDDQAEKTQISVDRARAQSHNILRRSLAELRKLQTERTLREQAEEINEDSIEENSFCKPAPQTAPQTSATPRNALCPCGSGTKYKRCCGKDAPPVLNLAA